MMAFTANEGTQTDIYSIENAGTEIGIVKIDIGVGSEVQDFGGSMASLGKGTITSVGTAVGVGTITNLGSLTDVGTVKAVANLAKGTITALAKGTISAGTIGTVVGAGTITNLGSVTDVGTVKAINNLAFGTVDTFYRHPDEFAVTVFTAGAGLGTIVGSVDGSQIFVTDLTVSVTAASNVQIASGGTSTGIHGTMFFAGSGGMAATYKVPLRTATGSALVFKQSATTGMTITAGGYID